MQYASPKPFRWSKFLMSKAIATPNRICGALILLCLSQNISAASAAEPVALLLDGKPLPPLGKGACKSQEKVTISLNEKILKDHDDFRAHVVNGDKNDSKKIPCPDSISDSTKVETFTKNSASVPMQFLIGGDKSTPCTGDGSAGEKFLCIYPETSGATKLIAYARVPYDTQQAKIEDITEIVAANGEIEFKVEMKAASRVKEALICFGEYINEKTKEDLMKGDCPKPFTPLTKDVTKKIIIDGLTNRKAYIFKVKLIDPGDNTQAWSEPKIETPIPIALPLSTYDGEGGELMYSCQSSPSSGSLLFFITGALLLILSRRRKGALMKSSLLVLPLLCLLPAKHSHADLGQVNVGLLGSMYRPDLDSERTSSGDTIFPFYKCFFRKDIQQEEGPINPLMGVEVDVHLWDGFGSLQAGLGLGYTYASGKGLEVDDRDQPMCDKPIENYNLKLHIYQLRPQLTYIFDPYVDYFPLVPYVRGAFIVNGYSFQDRDHSAKEVITPSGKTIKANGFRFGYQGALGLMLRLDFLEPSAVRTARGSGFFNHVYLKGELSYTKIDTFGKPGFQFSPKDIMGSSLPLMWTFGLVFELP